MRAEEFALHPAWKDFIIVRWRGYSKVAQREGCLLAGCAAEVAATENPNAYLQHSNHQTLNS
jgi:hypothetical protein